MVSDAFYALMARCWIYVTLFNNFDLVCDLGNSIIDNNNAFQADT